MTCRISYLHEVIEKLTEINTFKTEKTTVSSTFLIRFRFQGYLCKSGIDIFTWRVTWNYAYCTFKDEILKTLTVLGYLNFFHSHLLLYKKHRQTLIRFKGTASLISSGPLYKDGNVRCGRCYRFFRVKKWFFVVSYKQEFRRFRSETDWTLPIFHLGSLEIRFTVPLIQTFQEKNISFLFY